MPCRYLLPVWGGHSCPLPLPLTFAPHVESLAMSNRHVESLLTSAFPWHTIRRLSAPVPDSAPDLSSGQFCFASGGDLAPRERLIKIMRTTLILAMLFFATISGGQGKPDEAAIRNILQ